MYGLGQDEEAGVTLVAPEPIIDVYTLPSTPMSASPDSGWDFKWSDIWNPIKDILVTGSQVAGNILGPSAMSQASSLPRSPYGTYPSPYPQYPSGTLPSGSFPAFAPPVQAGLPSWAVPALIGVAAIMLLNRPKGRR